MSAVRPGYDGDFDALRLIGPGWERQHQTPRTQQSRKRPAMHEKFLLAN